MRDLERRGLLQYDARNKRYDLHPVVRAVAAGRINEQDKERHGQRVVDYFLSKAQDPYEQAETLEDLSAGLQVVRTLIKLGRYEEAAKAFRGDLSYALGFNLEAHSEILSLFKPFFANGWDLLPRDLEPTIASYLMNDVAFVLDELGQSREALRAYGASLLADLEREDWREVNIRLRNISINLADQNLLSKSRRFCEFALDLSTIENDQQSLFMSRLFLFTDYARTGQSQQAQAIRDLLDPMGRSWSRGAYRRGRAEFEYARFQFWQATLLEEHLSDAEGLAQQGKNRTVLRYIHRLRGLWRLDRNEWSLAGASFEEAVRMARERSIPDAESETGLALAKFHLGRLDDPKLEAQRLSELRNPADRLLAMLHFAIGDFEAAKRHALAAYRWAWADGEPFVNRYELTKTTELLEQIKVPTPELPPYDPAQDEKLPWEDAITAAIEKLRAEKKA